MSFPSFEETNNPGYDEVFKKEENEKGKKQSFSFFRKISNIFTKHKETKKEINNLNFLIEQIRPIIDNSQTYEKDVEGNVASFINIFNQINNGYKPTKKQDKIIKELLHDNFSTYIGVKYLDKLSLEVKIPDNYLIFFTIYTSRTFKYDDKNNKNINKLIYERFLNKNYRRNLFLEWNKMFQDVINNKTYYKDLNQKEESSLYDSRHDYFENKITDSLYTFGNYILYEATEDEFFEILKGFKRYPKMKKPKLNLADINDRDYMNKAWLYQNCVGTYARSFGDVIDRKGWYRVNKSSNSKVENILKEKEGIKAIVKEKEFSDELKSALKSIEDKYREIMADQDLLSNDQLFNVKNIYEKRIPESLKTYNEIYQDGKESIKNSSNKSPNEILNNSLRTIDEIMDALIEDINYQKLNKLSVTETYVKSMNKKIH